MRLHTLLSASLLSTALCAQTEVTVTTGPTNATQSFYSLHNGVQGTATLASWDLAFEIAGFTSSILVNTAKGLTAFETPAAISEWASVNAPDEGNWIPLNNSDSHWSAGALTNGNNLSEPDGFNVGWGTYNMVTHTIAGTKIYVIGLGDGAYRKLRINALASGTFSFTHADLDGSNEVTSTLQKSNFTGKNFGYFSFATGVLDVEPPSDSWDLVFTKYVGFVPTPYPVAGVLQNKNVTALQVDGVDPAIAQWWGEEFRLDINIIGSDWKTFNMTTFQYEYAQDRTYFVQDRSGNVWKLIFTGYGGSATGDMTFTQELMSSVGVDEETTAENALVIFPNPVSQGSAQLVLNTSAPSVSISILDLSGKLVRTIQRAGVQGLGSHVLDLNGLNAGMYLVRVQGEGLDASTRLVVE